MFRTIFHLLFLGAGFLIGIYVGVHFPATAAKIDQTRQADAPGLEAKIQAAVSAAKIELLNRVLNTNGQTASTGAPTPGSGFVGSGFVGGSSSGGSVVPGAQRQALMAELQAETAKLADAQAKQMQSGNQ